MRRALLGAIVLCAAIFAIATWRSSPPSSRGDDAPTETFSAARARRIQESISKVAPRPPGSPGHAQAEEYLEAVLGQIPGFRTEKQHGFACGRHGSCAFVTNIVAIKEGTEPTAAPVLMMAHWDAVPASSGASDDGNGTAAVVEAARAIAASPPLRRTVAAVLTDAEEEGLLGAEAFAHGHPLATAARAIVNVDSRGCCGPAVMFETSSPNAWVVEQMAARLDRPVTASLFYEVYKRMPNDTDFSVFSGVGAGVNFANTRGIQSYHTPLDAIAYAELGTLQHHGDQVLAMTRAFADAPDLETQWRSGGDAVWFDVLALGIVHWPVHWTLPLACAALVILIGQVIRLRAIGRGGLLGLAVFPVSLAASVLATWAGGLALHYAHALPAPWPAHPGWALGSLHLATIAAGAAAGGFVVRRSSPLVAYIGVWGAVAVVGVAVAVVAPGAAYLQLVPALFAGVALFLPLEIACVVPVAVAAVLLFPLGTALYDALGLVAPPAVASGTAFVVAGLAPLLGAMPRRAPYGIGAIAAFLLAIACASPPFSKEVPQRVNVAFVQENDGARVAVTSSWARFAWGEPPVAMADALGGVKGRALLPWSTDGLVADATPITAPPPKAYPLREATAHGRRQSTFHVASPRHADAIVLELPRERAPIVTIRGQRASMRWGVVALYAVPEEGIDVDVDMNGEDPLPVVVRDVSWGVPAGSLAAKVVAARPESACQTQDGDVTVLVTRVDL